jgi:hypothetical protein
MNASMIAMATLCSAFLPRDGTIASAPDHAADNLMGSMTEGSSFSGLLTRVEIGHMLIGSDGNGRIKSRGSTRLREDHGLLDLS